MAAVIQHASRSRWFVEKRAGVRQARRGFRLCHKQSGTFSKSFAASISLSFFSTPNYVLTHPCSSRLRAQCAGQCRRDWCPYPVQQIPTAGKSS